MADSKTIDDLVGAVGDQTSADQRDRAREGRDRKKGEESLLEYQKREARKQTTADKKNARLQGIESHMTKQNQMFNYKAQKSLRDRGVPLAKLVRGMKEKIARTFDEVIGPFLKRSTVGIYKRLKKAKDSGIKNLQQHADVTNIWGAMKTDVSLLMGMVGAIAQIPGFQTFFTVAKVILGNISIVMIQIFKFLTTGFWKLLWEGIKWVARSFASHAGAWLMQPFNPIYSNEDLEAWQAAQAGEKAGAGAGMFAWAGPLGTDEDPFYIMPSSLFQSQRDDPKGLGGDGDGDGKPEELGDPEGDEAPKKTGFFAGIWAAITRRLGNLFKEIKKLFIVLGALIIPHLKKLRAKLKKAIKWLWASLILLTRTIRIALVGIIKKLVKVLWLFIVTMAKFIWTLMLIVGKLVLQLIVQLVTLAAQLVTAIAGAIGAIISFIAVNILWIAIAVAVGLLLWSLWGAWEYMSARFVEFGERIRLFGDKIALLWDIAGDALYVGIQTILFGTVEMLENTFNSIIDWWNNTKVASFTGMTMDPVDWGGGTTMTQVRAEAKEMGKKHQLEASRIVALEAGIDEAAANVKFNWKRPWETQGYERQMPTIMQNISAGKHTTYVGSTTSGNPYASMYNSNLMSK